MTVKDLQQKTFVESRMIFPTSVTATNKNTKNKLVQLTVLTEEKKAADDANRKRRRQKIFFVLTIVIFVIAQIFMYILLFKKWKQAIPKKVITPIHHYLEIPTMKPSIARMIVRDSHHADTRGLTGDLCYKKLLTRICV